MARKNNFRLTPKTARTLIKKEFGFTSLPTGKLEVERAEDGVYIYTMHLGRFAVTIQNDWYEQNGLIDMRVLHKCGESFHLYFEPDALQEDYEAEEKRRQKNREEQCNGCAFREAARV